MIEIEGKPFRQIFDEMGWPFRLVLVLGAAFILFTIVYVPYLVFHVSQKEEKPEMLKLFNNTETIVGFFDPSIASDGIRHVMIYGAAIPVADGLDIIPRLSYAFGDCPAWHAMNQQPFESVKEEIIGPDGMTPVTTGRWRIEQASILYNPDSKGREWQAYAYKYFWAGSGPLAKLYSVITTAHTSDPTTGWSREEWLFSASDGRPPYPYNKTVRQHLDRLDPSLADIYFYSRPSVAYINGVTLMSLSAFRRGENDPHRLILLASTDHGKSWSYRGVLLTRDDARRLGAYDKLGGGGLLVSKGQLYFFVTLGAGESIGDGALVLSFDDIANAKLARDASGKPKIVNRFGLYSQKPAAPGGGHIAWHDACTSPGVISSEFSGVLSGNILYASHKPLLPK